MSETLNAPHGGVLRNLVVGSKRAEELRTESRGWASWDLSARQLCDLELLMNGGFSPLSGFMSRRDYDRVCEEMRLGNGNLWPIPVTLDITEVAAARLHPGDALALRDPEGVMLAALHIEDLWRPDLEKESVEVFGTDNPEHPGVRYLRSTSHPVYVGGRLEGIQGPVHYDYRDLRLTPAELREEFTSRGWSRVVAFQTRNPMHRAHVELTRRAAEEVDASLLIHPSVGMTKPGDVDHYTRVRCYQAVLDRYPDKKAALSLLPLAMRMGGPREAVWHAIIRKNHGCTHLIVGRDHAGPGSDSSGKPFYGPYDAQQMLAQHEAELGMGMVDFKMMVYAPEHDEYYPEDQVPAGVRTVTISGTQLREKLMSGDEIPEWFSYPEVVTELRRTHPPRSEQGFTVFFTGLSGSGKSTIANALLVKLLEIGGRSVTMLDGDLVRKHLSSELGFSKEHRDLNIRRIGYVASEITKAGGVAICAPIAPYDSTRRSVREGIEAEGGFFLVHVDTPIEVCEARDRKGLYAKARAGLIPEFTGISDPYETPTDAELVIDTTSESPEDAASRIVEYLRGLGFFLA